MPSDSSMARDHCTASSACKGRVPAAEANRGGCWTPIDEKSAKHMTITANIAQGFLWSTASIGQAVKCFCNAVLISSGTSAADIGPCPSRQA